LFNRFTQSDVYAADQLFATLDPTLRKIELPEVGRVVLADTVGFIRHLPHDLVAAFKATLTETREAELLLHVIDVADERRDDNITQVETVLNEIEADEVPQLLICNKIDMLPESKPRIDRDEQGKPIRVWLSAQLGLGLELLEQALQERLGTQVVKHRLKIPPSAGKFRSIFHQLNCIADETFDEQGNCLLAIKLPLREWNRLLKQQQSNLEHFIEH